MACHKSAVVEETRVVILHLNSAVELGSEFREILQSCAGSSFTIRQECFHHPSEDGAFAELLESISGFDPRMLFVVSTGYRPEPTRKLVESLRGKSVVAVCDNVQPQDMLELLKLGVADFITTPLRPADVLARVWHILERTEPTRTIAQTMKEKLGLKHLVGKSPPFLAEVEKIPLVARCDVGVLISGETGTGKELFARAIHYLSPRAGRPLVPVSCGAIPADLLENELFGHVRGAYTGANSALDGLVHEARGGTLFLDEIDCLPLASQAKLLRFLQENEYKQLGSSRVCRADSRVIAATNIDLQKAVRGGRFRQDLYYRLNVVSFVLPPLRERKEDIPLLARHFAGKYAGEYNGRPREFTPEEIRGLVGYDWPGNVRELENLVKRALVLASEGVAERVETPRDAGSVIGGSFKAAKATAIEQFEKNYIQDLLVAYHGNISRAAEAVHKNRRALWELIRKHGIDATRYRSLPQEQDN